MLANSFAINDEDVIEIDPFDNHSDDSMCTDDVEWGCGERTATWNMDHDKSDCNVTSDGVGNSSPVENWD